jgi:hypothetical protein
MIGVWFMAVDKSPVIYAKNLHIPVFYIAAGFDFMYNTDKK